MENDGEKMKKVYKMILSLVLLILVLIPADCPAASGDYEKFNTFCLENYGANKDELYYFKFGKELRIDDNSIWMYLSENSACIAWETNLPSRSYIEYGVTDKYGEKTTEEERYFFVHIQYLKSLITEKSYHYRLVSVDERGNKITSEDKVLETKKIKNSVRIPDEAGKINYLLNVPMTTYILTKDIKLDEDYFAVIGDKITVDLNGYTISFDFEAGVKAGKAKNIKIVNGTIKQIVSDGMSGNNRSDYFNPLTLSGCADAEIAGLTIDYEAPQAWGVNIIKPEGSCDIHHNVFLDRGTVISSRHGWGVRPLGFSETEKGINKFRIYSNLIKRTRQNGFHVAQKMYNNEIYVDSWSINSFALQPAADEGEYYNNRIFGTGFNAYGFGWASTNLKISDNFVHMQGINASSRWGETWGDINMLSAMRVTNYDKGGQVRNNLEYKNNVVVIKGREGCEIRGTEFMSDISIKDLVYHDNTVKVEVQDDKTSQAACVDAQGQVANNDTALPVFYKNNTYISNICHVRFGDSYGRGSNHQFINCKFVRTGSDPRYHTFIFDGGWWSHRHVFLDCEFGDGTRYNDVLWKKTSPQSSYSVKWTLAITSLPKADITIIDKRGRIEFTGKTDADGKVSAVLTQCLIKPPDNMKGDEPNNDKHQEVEYTPHSVVVEKNGVTKRAKVTMDKKQELDVKME
ncbi:MAG: hypothetical protein A2231_08665 [Candidatus Firestonebacteria bacterium RIFOXYA2_FULL_40_8]|nr:MAG: hypothetical protein A2231_08665 [Candidatus Firestonebacteria bacterium RIFOXYA2_FULL_40_8]